MVNVKMDGQDVTAHARSTIEINSGSRLYGRWERCAECGEWEWFESVVWVDGEAFHTDCAPEQYPEDQSTE